MLAEPLRTIRRPRLASPQADGDGGFRFGAKLLQLGRDCFQSVAGTSHAAQAPGAVWFPEESKATLRLLQGEVAAGTVTAAEAQLLSNAVGRLGVISQAQAVRSVKKLGGLPMEAQNGFRGLLAGLGTDTQRAFLWKALGAGRSLNELQGFAPVLRAHSDAQLLDLLTLSDPQAINGGPQDGLIQQESETCLPAVVEALIADADPIFAYAARTQNRDVHSVDDANFDAVNPQLADQEKQWLEKLGGGIATARNDPKDGNGAVDWDAVLTQATPYTGYRYSFQRFAPEVSAVARALEIVQAQVGVGIKTPFRVTSPDNEGGHALLAMEILGQGDAQAFAIHDPLPGNTVRVSRSALATGTFKLDNWSRVGGYVLATPAEPGLPNPQPAAPTS